jgi:hypothetical protein
MRKGRFRWGSLYRSIRNATIIAELTINVSMDAANAKLSKAPPPPLAWYQLKKNAKKDVIDMMIPIAATGDWYLGYIQPTPLGSMFKSARALTEYALQQTPLRMVPSCPSRATITTIHCRGFPPKTYATIE